MIVRGSRTEQNLLAAFAGESMAANKYDFFAEQAGQEGLEQIKGYFQETAENERQHAKRIFTFLQGIGNTEANLDAGIAGEHEEWTELYKEMEQTAKEEGFSEIALFFQNVAAVEKEHEARYAALRHRLKEGETFKGDAKTVWVCRNCGFVHEGEEPPKTCPVCKYPQGYYERKAKNY